MTFVVHMQITADGKIAQAEVRETTNEVKSLGAANESMGRKGRKAAGDLSHLAGSVEVTEQEIRQLILAERSAGQVAMQTGNAHRVAAGQIGNLVAQGNDVFMMMAAGQNPLQLALQQGTQITQVIGPMGAAGAFSALRTAALSMLSPLNLFTIGSIAAGAALTQWLFGADEEVMKLEDRIEATRDLMEAFSESSEKSRLSFVGMMEEFGTADPVLKSIIADMTAMKKVELYQSLDAQADGIRNLVLDLSFWDDRSGQSAAQDFLGLDTINASAREASALFERNLDLLSQSEEPAAKLRAALDLREQLLDAAGGLENLNTKQKEFYDGLAATIRDLILFGAKIEEANQAPSLGAWQQYYATRIAGEEQVQNILARQTSEMAKIYGYAADTRMQSAAELDKGNQMLADLQQEVALKQAALAYGADSFEVAELRANAERVVFEKSLATLEVSDGLNKSLRQSHETALKFSQIEMALGVGAAAAEAKRLNEELGITLGLAISLAQMGPQGTAPASHGGRGDPRSMGGSFSDWQNSDAIVFLENWKPPKAKRGGADREAEAVTRLVAQMQLELDLLRETDPVQQEMLRHRETLASATAAERAEVERLITTRLAEQQAIEAVQEAENFLNQTLYDSFRSSIEEGEGLIGVLERIGIAALDAAAQALFLGEGWMADLLGISGGLFSLGGSASAVSASAASASIASIQAPLSASYSASSASSEPSVVRLELSENLVATTLQTSAAASVEIAEAVVTNYDRNLPARMQEIQDDPRVVG